MKKESKPQVSKSAGPDRDNAAFAAAAGTQITEKNLQPGINKYEWHAGHALPSLITNYLYLTEAQLSDIVKLYGPGTTLPEIVTTKAYEIAELMVAKGETYNNTKIIE